MKCLRLLGALKKASEPSAISLGTRTPGEASTALTVEVGDGSLGPPRNSARAMANVEFAVSFRLGGEGANQQTLGGAVRSPRETHPVSELERGEEGRADMGAIGTAVWMEGVAHSYDVRNKVLFIDAVGRNTCRGTAGTTAGRPTTDCSREIETGNDVTPARKHPADEEQEGRGRTEGGQRRRSSYARHVLDVRLLSCLSSQGDELFDQLQAFSCAFKTGLALASLDVAVDAAARLGVICREVFSELVLEFVKEGVATEAYRNERLAVAARGIATAAVGSILRAAQRAVILARRFVSGRGARRKSPDSAAGVNNAGTGEQRPQRVRTPTSITAVQNSSPHTVGKSSGESSPGQHTIIVDRSAAARIRFRCTTIVSEKRRKVPRGTVAVSVAGAGREGRANSSSGVTNINRRDLQYLTKWT